MKKMNAWCAGNGQLHQMSMDSVTNTLDCMHDQQMVLGEVREWKHINNGQEMKEMDENEKTCTANKRKYVLRRLTPLECLRLQGLPDWWCDGVDGSDSAIYRMCGNGLAIPCAYNVMQRIAGELQKGEKNND